MEKYGKYRGIVINNNDLMQRGRILVIVPEVSGQLESWAMPCLPYAGKGSGFFALPEIGTGVWIEFEGGDPSFPIWSGGYWGEDEIPKNEKDMAASPDLKIFRTTQGLMITFNDKENIISLSDKNGNNILSIDSGQGIIKLCANYKVVVEGPEIELGENAIHPVVLGDDLLNYLNQLVATFNTHVHPGELNAPPAPAANLPDPLLLSLKVKTG